MAKNYTLQDIFNIIELYKYAEIDGECLSIHVSYMNDSDRTISIGLKSSKQEDRFVLYFNDNKTFDEYLLPALLKRFLEGDERKSWTNVNNTELITTISGNEFLIESANNYLHDKIGNYIENSKYKENTELTKEDEAIDLILRYLKQKFKVRKYLDNLLFGLKNEVITIIDRVYKSNRGKNLTNEDIINIIRANRDNMSREAQITLTKDYDENNFLLVKDIKDYLQNESNFSNYLDEEPYISIRDVGIKLINDGYFAYGFMPTQKMIVENLVDENTRDIVMPIYRAKFTFLTKEVDKFVKIKDEATASVIRKYISYLVKVTKLRTNKKEVVSVDIPKKQSEEISIPNNMSNIDLLSSYFRKELLKEKGMLSINGDKEILELRKKSKEVDEIETAREKMLKQEISSTKFEEIYNYYKNYLMEEMKKGYKGGFPNVSEKEEPPKPIKKNKFNTMKLLNKEYKVLLDSNGELNIFNRKTNKKYIPSSEEEKKLIELSNLWSNLVGIKSSKDDVTIGSTFAYNEDNERLFNIIEKCILNYVDKKGILAINYVKTLAREANIPESDKLVERIFSTDNHINYLTETFNEIRNIDLNKVIKKKVQVIDPKYEGELQKIIEAYNVADYKSNDKLSSNIKIQYPSNDEKCLLSVTLNKQFSEKVLYKNEFPRNVIIGYFLRPLVDCFFDTSGITNQKNFYIPNSNNSSAIVLGRNNNSIQLTNAKLEDAMLLTRLVNDKKKQGNENKL